MSSVVISADERWTGSQSSTGFLRARRRRRRRRPAVWRQGGQAHLSHDTSLGHDTSHTSLFRRSATTQHSLGGSFSAVSTPNLATKYACCSIFQNLQNYLTEISKSCNFFAIFCKISQNFPIFFIFC